MLANVTWQILVFNYTSFEAIIITIIMIIMNHAGNMPSDKKNPWHNLAGGRISATLSRLDFSLFCGNDHHFFASSAYMESNQKLFYVMAIIRQCKEELIKIE